MLQQLRFGAYFVEAGIRHVLKKPWKVPVDNQFCLDTDHANSCIKKGLESENPFMACRFGSGEMLAFIKTREVKMGLRKTVPEGNMDSMCINAGFFPREQKQIMRFGDEMEDACTKVDLLAIWGTIPMERYVIDTYVKQAELCKLGGLEPFFTQEPWTQALEGKKVLVIHPFEETIRKQYEKRQLLFSDPRILPEFELLTLKAVQTIAGTRDERFRDWFEALSYMETEALKKDFDIAIIGCGAYGFPLAARLKAAGKKVIHMGGATQLLFGIRGQRWEARENYQSLMNEHWCRPAESEKPMNSGKVENNCYW